MEKYHSPLNKPNHKPQNETLSNKKNSIPPHTQTAPTYIQSHPQPSRLISQKTNISHSSIPNPNLQIPTSLPPPPPPISHPYRPSNTYVPYSTYLLGKADPNPTPSPYLPPPPPHRRPQGSAQAETRRHRRSRVSNRTIDRSQPPSV